MYKANDSKKKLVANEKGILVRPTSQREQQRFSVLRVEV